MQYAVEIEKPDGTMITLITYPEMIKAILGYCEFKEITIRKGTNKNG